MAITRTPIIDDDGTGTTGTVIDNAWKTELYNQIDATAAVPQIGAWTDVPFNAANFTASGSTWTVTAGQVVLSKTLKLGPLYVWAFNFDGTTIAAGAGSLTLACPVAGSISFVVPTALAYPHVSGTGFQLAALQGGPTAILLQRPDNSGIPAGTCYLRGSIMFVMQ